MRRFVPALHDLPVITATEHWIPWINLAKDGGHWKSLLNLAVRHYLGHLQDQRRLTVWRCDIADIFVSHGQQVPPIFAPRTPDGGYVCYLCGDVALVNLLQSTVRNARS